MKNFLKKAILFKLKILAKLKLKKINAQIIGITGSAGKTSLKDAVALILSSEHKVKKTRKSFNSEWGLPLDLLNQKSAYGSPISWIKVLILAFIDLLTNNEKYDYYVVEMGVDKPGDMDYLLGIFEPDYSVILNIYPAHIGNFPGGYAEYADQKRLIAEGTSEKGFVLIPSDMDGKSDMESRAEVITFGKQGSYITDGVQVSAEGISFDLRMPNGGVLEIKNSMTLGEEYVNTFAAAAAVCNELNVSSKNIVEGIRKYAPPPGRLRLIEGESDVLIIDSSYNASQIPTINALKTLGRFKDRRKIACIGDMRELGKAEKEEHKALIPHIKENSDLVVLVGPLTKKYILPGLEQIGFPGNKIHHFMSSKIAGKFLKNEILNGGEVVLCKGSQNTILMERIVYELMKDKRGASELLCRQDSYWDKIRKSTP